MNYGGERLPVGQREGRFSESLPAGSPAGIDNRARRTSHASIRSGFLPDYPGFGRGIFFQAILDLLSVLSWIVFFVLLLLSVGMPLIVAMLFVWGG